MDRVGYTVGVARQALRSSAQRYRENVGDLVRRARRDADLTQSDLGTHLGVSRQAIADYEKGQSPMLLEHLPILVTTLRLDPRRVAAPPEKARYERPVSDFLLDAAAVEALLDAAADSGFDEGVRRVDDSPGTADRDRRAPSPTRRPPDSGAGPE